MKIQKFSFALIFFIIAAGIISCNNQPQKQASKPNILFCIADDATYAHFGAYGCDWVKTPAFDRVASEGLLFKNAYTPNAKCAPSRSCILTGRNSWQLEQAANHWCYFPQKFKTYAEVLNENGYHVGYTDKGWAPGVPGEIDGKKRQLTGTPFNKYKTTPPTSEMSVADYTANFKDFLDSNSDDKPFCFWYGSREPHRRYEYGTGISQGGKKITEIDSVFSFWPDNDTVRTDLLDYAYEIEYFDQHLHNMLKLLEERGELDNTIVVVTADNGMPFPRIKGQEYEFSNHLPLAIMWKNGITNPGREINDLVNFIDFSPTFLEISGIKEETSGMQAIEGKSLTNIFASKKEGVVDATRDHVLIGKERHDVGRPHDQGYPIRGIVKDGFLYVKNFENKRWPAGNPETGYLNCDGSPTKTVLLNGKDQSTSHHLWELSFDRRSEEELYQIAVDKECMNNLAEDEKYAQIKEDLKNQLFDELKQQGDPRMFGNGHIFDEYIYADKAHQNFYERFMSGEKIDAGWVTPNDFRE